MRIIYCEFYGCVCSYRRSLVLKILLGELYSRPNSLKGLLARLGYLFGFENLQTRISTIKSVYSLVSSTPQSA
jgi:hypothetical protein